jgi:hypothetical protein
MGPPLKGGVYQFVQWRMSLVSEGDFSTTRWGLKKSLTGLRLNWSVLGTVGEF